MGLCTPFHSKRSIFWSSFHRQTSGHHAGVREAYGWKLESEFSQLKLHGGQRLFDRRSECVAWLPEEPASLLAGSHGGDICKWAPSTGSIKSLVAGKGKGGSIIQMKVLPNSNGSKLVTVSHDQCIKVHDLLSGTYDCLHNTGRFNKIAPSCAV
ncbi:hypothetical protein CYMTET_56171 [Cymbomonas tetramitiformis]|uniref:Uncharacterized protein n=1 Tax=Cymbomonas tetramitiformis TaxID=36881 RepID=A0AAE0EM36_9CHLO|nr:hypothetical protein CYMTET_56171 [Cymbomonas tetramitiformis]